MGWFTKSVSEEIERLYRAESQGIFRSVMARGASREVALDVVQNAFVKVYAHLEKTKNFKNVKSLVYTTAINLWRDEVKRKKSDSLEVLQEDGFDVPSTMRSDEWAQVRMVREFLDKLDEGYRVVVAHSILDGLSPRDIAAIIGLSTNVVSVRLHRGMKQLREMCEGKM